jgi:hypothetical protein
MYVLKCSLSYPTLALQTHYINAYVLFADDKRSNTICNRIPQFAMEENPAMY